MDTLSDVSITLVWFRRDLRFDDNVGFYNALKQEKNVQPVFIFDTNILNDLEIIMDRRVSFIHEKVAALKYQLNQIGSDLWVFHGAPIQVFEKVFTTQKVDALYCNTDYEPYSTLRDKTVEALCQQHQVVFKSFKDQVVFEKQEVVKPDGLPYTVFTPYSKRWKALLLETTLPDYNVKLLFNKLNRVKSEPILTLQQIGFEPIQHQVPEPNIESEFLKDYGQSRNLLGIKGTSRTSVHLRFGTISIRQLVRQAINYPEYLNELIWREFYMQWLWHFPHVVTQSFKPAYDNIAWNTNDTDFERWCSAKTGYHIVDAAMNELLQTGYMHNRARMITASFLTKHLLIDWRKGEAFFARHLTDYELSSNVGGWQWASGSGCDAAPYFRIFNPTLQTQKFDPNGVYIKKWKGNNGISPMVEHNFARNRCIETYKKGLNF